MNECIQKYNHNIALVEKKNTRESNFELLRIITMIMIVIYHMMLYGGFTDIGKYTTNKLIAQFFMFGGKLGVNIYILMMGFFMVESKIKIKKIFKLTFQMIFYSVLFALITKIRLNISFKELYIIKYFFPNYHLSYWFVTMYILVYIISPFNNKMIKSLEKENCRKLIILLTFLISIIPTVIKKYDSNISNFLTWFIYLYIIRGIYKSIWIKF